MKAISYTAARENLAKTMENVCKDHAPVIVTRKSNDSVVIGLSFLCDDLEHFCLVSIHRKNINIVFL
jgi:prevent-host-death family protein